MVVHRSALPVDETTLPEGAPPEAPADSPLPPAPLPAGGAPLPMLLRGGIGGTALSEGRAGRARTLFLP